MSNRKTRKMTTRELQALVEQHQAEAAAQAEREAAERALASPTPALDWDSAPPLERLAYMHRIASEIAADIAAEVAAARRAGVSWHRIGLAFDITGEGARRRWA